MKNPKKKLLLAAAVCALLSGATAMADTTTFAVVAQVTDNLTATVNNGIDFGTVYFSCAGSLTLAANDAVTENGCVSQYGGTPAAAEIDIAGTADAVVDITLPAGSTTLNAGGVDNLTVNTWTSDAVAGQITLTGGTRTLNIGANLVAAASVADGAYTALAGSGNPTLTFAYD